MKNCGFMLCKRSEPFDSKDFIFELKLDGTRAFFMIEKGKLKIINRRKRDITHRYPEFSKVPNFIKAKEAVIDGEIVVLNDKGLPDFYSLEKREQTSNKIKIELLSQTTPATFFAFDIISLNGKDLTECPLLERKKILKKVLKKNPYVIYLDFVEGNGKALFKKVSSLGLEGIVAKRKNSIYECGKRSENWLKIKNLNTLDCVIVGYTKGKGKREKYFGALLLAIYDKGKLKYVGRVGTGWDEEESKKIMKLLEKYKTESCALKVPLKKDFFCVKPKLVCEVKFMSFSPRGELRAPSFIRMRFDKPPKDCTKDF